MEMALDRFGASNPLFKFMLVCYPLYPILNCFDKSFMLIGC